jgi:tetratricopeptide (TPR) repeat protein
MPHPVLDDVRRIKQKATVLRNLKKYKEALEQFDAAVQKLDALLVSAECDADDARAARVELADTYGMKGGTYRRWVEHPDHRRLALQQYRKGLVEERKDKQSTYNAGNVIALSISDERIPLDDALRSDLDRGIDELTHATQGRRKDEFWAWADLAQLHLVRKDLDQARASYRKALDTGPKPDELRRHIDVLRELGEGARAFDIELGDMIASTIRELEQAQTR